MSMSRALPAWGLRVELMDDSGRMIIWITKDVANPEVRSRFGWPVLMVTKSCNQIPKIDLKARELKPGMQVVTVLLRGLIFVLYIVLWMWYLRHYKTEHHPQCCYWANNTTGKGRRDLKMPFTTMTRAQFMAFFATLTVVGRSNMWSPHMVISSVACLTWNPSGGAFPTASTKTQLQSR